jgi:hypothetical protein
MSSLLQLAGKTLPDTRPCLTHQDLCRSALHILGLVHCYCILGLQKTQEHKAQKEEEEEKGGSECSERESNLVLAMS